MIDLKSFIERKGLSKADLCRKLDMDPKSSLMSSYEKGRSNPSYEKCEKLIRLGITLQELFGNELGNMLIENSFPKQPASEPDNSPIDYSDPKFQEGFEKTLAGMKARGMIKDEVAKTIAEMKANGEL